MYWACGPDFSPRPKIYFLFSLSIFLLFIVGSVCICIFTLISSIIFQFQIINVLSLDVPSLFATPVIKAVIKYTNADTQKEQISNDNRGFCGIYR